MAINSDYDRFAPDELAVVLSHYELGVIESAKEFYRGSRRAPKLLLQSPQGRYLLKRRAAGRDDPFRVAFSHALVTHLRARQFPSPALVETRDGETSVLQVHGRVYEVFEFVEAERYDASLEQTTRAGLTLAAFHDAVQDFATEWNPPQTSYHDSASVRYGLNAIPTVTSEHDSVVGHEAELLQLTQQLHDLYDDAAEAVNRAGFAQWPMAIIHGDWHPGNLLYRGERVAAVIDFDAAKFQPPVIDVASGMLQFSILRASTTPDAWPDFFDEARMRRFLGGYQSRREVPPEQRAAVAALMVESLVSEAAVPIAATGSFGRLPGFGILQMVARKVRWLRENAERIKGWLLE